MPVEVIKINKKALTLVEILVATVILALVVTGLANVFVSGKRYIKQSRLRMAGGEIGKKFLDPLQSYVRQDTWSTNPLGSGAIDQAVEGSTSPATTYTANYVVSTVGGIKKVKVTVSLPEAD